MVVWIQFAVCSLLVIVTGTYLSRYADILAEKTGLGRSWVGAILLAGATSLPEMATGISAVTIVGNVNLAAGGVMGSCLFNLLLIAILDVVSGPTPLLRRVNVGQSLAAVLGAVLLATVAGSLFVTQTLSLPSIGWLGLPSIIIFGIYIVSVRIISLFEQRRAQEVLEQQAEAFQYEAISLRRAIIVFALLALAIVGLGLWLAQLGEQITTITGLGPTFVGAIFLAVTTSLPEVVASIAALRINAVDLAVSNIFGSNIFNIVALAIYDLTYLPGNMWLELNAIHGFTAIAATLMTALALVGLVYRAARRPRTYVSWDALFLMLIYVGSMYVVYAVGGT